MKYFFASILIHLSIFLYASFSVRENSIAAKPNIDSNASVIHISLKLQENEVKELSHKISKLKNKKLSKLLDIKKSISKKLAVSREKQSKVIGEELLNEYVAEIRSFIETKKYYPKKARRMRQSGAVEICLEIDNNGNFHNIHIKKASNFTTLNKAALALVTEISKFKPLPKEMGEKFTLSIPLKYALND